ncbi:MAG: metallophosphoesterase [Verrucomicrobia bacterium]|nr:metallophosphoesterase [Verrucomicrobiota bacterium]
MIADWQFVRVMLFAAGIVLTYWLAARWTFDRWRASTPRSRLDRWFRSAWIGGVLLSLAGIGLACMAYGLFIEPRQVTVKTYSIQTPKLRPGERLRLVHLADLHVRGDGPREKALPEIVRLLHPDVILHTGDFFGTRADVDANVIRLLHSWDVPQYACEGNLDRLGRFEHCMRRAGVVLLNGARRESCSVRGTRLSISGFPSGAEEFMHDNLKGLSPETFNVVLYHHPQAFPETWGTAADLMLAGHTHGGQIRLPFYGALITLDRFGKRWESGLFEERGVHLIVSRGIGCEPDIPEMRFCCPPEVVVVDLSGCSRSSSQP